MFFTVADRSYFSIIKKEIHKAATNANFTNYKVAEIDIIVAELVSNLVKHAKGGYLLVKLLADEGIEIISMDDGPGMADVGSMVQDGVSTKKTLGTGLGAIKRMSDVFQVYSLKGWGTVVLVRVYKNEVKAPPGKIEISTVVIPKPGEVKCGDGFYVKTYQDYTKILVGDGLGHGAEAEKAVKEAITMFKICIERTCFESLRFIHQNVKKTRGLVATVAILNHKERKWSICGIGNIQTRIVSPVTLKNYMSYNGVVGLNIPNSLKDQESTLEKGQMMILCSDGIKTRWDLNKYPGIFKYDLSIITATIFKDFARKTDDMSIMAVKYNL